MLTKSIKQLSTEELYDEIDVVRGFIQGSEGVATETFIQARSLVKEVNRRARAVTRRYHGIYSQVTFEQLFGER